MRRGEKLLNTYPINRTSKIDYSKVHSKKASMDSMKLTFESIIPFDSTFKARVDEANKTLKVLEAKNTYKK